MHHETAMNKSAAGGRWLEPKRVVCAFISDMDRHRTGGAQRSAHPLEGQIAFPRRPTTDTPIQNHYPFGVIILRGLSNHSRHIVKRTVRHYTGRQAKSNEIVTRHVEYLCTSDA